MEAMLAAVRAADQATLHSLYFPEHGHVKAAAVAGCVCVDDLTCTECERILGVSFLAIELAARKKLRTDPPVPVARVDTGPVQALGPGSHGVEGSDKAMSSGVADRLGRGSRQRSDEGSGEAISSMADRPGQGSRPPSDGIMGSVTAISSMADCRLMPGSNLPSDGVEGSDAAISGTADQLVTGSHPPSDGIEGSDAAISSMADRRLVPGSLPPSDAVEGSDAAFSGTVDLRMPGSPPPSDGIEASEPPISSMADRLGLSSNGRAEGFEAGISGMAAGLGLAAAVGERGKELFRKMEEARAWPPGPGRSGRSRFRSERPLVYAACLSIACRTEGSALSLRELARAAAGDSGAVERKDIARLVEHIRRRLGEEVAGHWQSTGTSMVCVSSYVRRLGSLVGLREADAAEALEAARRLEEGVLDVRHNADTMATAVVCIVLERAGAMRSGVDKVAAATGLAKHTIHAVSRKLRAHDDLLFG